MARGKGEREGEYYKAYVTRIEKKKKNKTRIGMTDGIETQPR